MSAPSVGHRFLQDLDELLSKTRDSVGGGGEAHDGALTTPSHVAPASGALVLFDMGIVGQQDGAPAAVTAFWADIDAGHVYALVQGVLRVVDAKEVACQPQGAYVRAFVALRLFQVKVVGAG